MSDETPIEIAERVLYINASLSHQDARLLANSFIELTNLLYAIKSAHNHAEMLQLINTIR